MTEHRDNAVETARAELLPQLMSTQEELWTKGKPVRLESLIEQHAELASDAKAMAELAYNEFQLRKSGGESPSCDEYYRRFPACRELLSCRFQMNRALEDTHAIIAGESELLSTEDLQATDAVRQPHSVEQMPSDLSKGRYEIIEELGRGGFGTVLRARDKRTGQVVALKTMKRRDGTSLELFKGEFRYLQGVSHYNLVQLYELESDGHDWLLSMEFVDGCDFMSYVRPAPKCTLDLKRLRESLCQLAEGIAALHRYGRVHRDLKPENVRVSPDGRVVILDFGLAAVLNPQGEHKSDLMAGTVAYMAPEQTDHPPVVSPASDWYAMGVMLFKALTTELPFQAGNALAVQQKKRTTPPKPPEELSPDVPQDLSDSCLALLRPDPAERPKAAEIFRRLGREPGELSPTWGRTSLWGRERQLQFLEEAYRDVQLGQPVMISVSGPSGIGKTALVRHFLEELEQRGAVVLAGRCYEHESVPYKALDPVVDELARYLRTLEPSKIKHLLPADVAPLTHVFPVLNRVDLIASAAQCRRLPPDPLEVRRQAFSGLRHLFTQLGRRQPLILSIDDLQWGDVDSANVLADLLHSPDAPRFMLLTSSRSEDADSPTLRALALALEHVETVNPRELLVEPLTEAETKELVVAQLGMGGAEHAKALAEESGGNPFFITELIHELKLNRGSDDVSVRKGISLDGLIRSRVDRLPENARRLLEIIAVSGRPLESTLAYQATEDVADGRLMMARLEAGRFVRGTGSGELSEVESYHDRIREAVVNGLARDCLRQHHEEIGIVLEESGSVDLEALAVHFEAADQHVKAGRYYGQAADRASQKLAFEHAANLYRKSLELQQLDATESRSLQGKLADALAAAGRGAEAAPVYVSVAERAEGLEQLELSRRAAEQFLNSGLTDEGVGTLRKLLGAVGWRLPGGPRRAFLSMLWQTIRVRLRGSKFRERPRDSISPEELWKIDVAHTVGYGLFMVDAATSTSYFMRSVRLALDSGEPLRMTRALANGSFLIGMEGRTAGKLATGWMSKGRTLIERIADPFSEVYVSYKLVALHWCFGRWKEALEQKQLADELSVDRQISFASYLTIYQHTTLDCMMMSGRWSDYVGCANLWLEDSRRRGNLSSTCIMLIHSYLAALSSDEPDVADELILEGRKTWPQKGNVMVDYWGLYGRVEVALYRKDANAAQELLKCEHRELNSNTHYKFIQTLNLIMVHLQGRVALAAATEAKADGDRSRSIRSATQQARRIEKANVPWSNPLAKLIRAGIANLGGQTVRATQFLAIAEEELIAANMELYAAATRRKRGELVGGDQGQAMVATADELITAQNVRKPDRIAEMLVPGFQH